MSVLSTISKPTDEAPIMTIYGEPGTGKTTLAATFPKPIVIRAEDGLQAIPEHARPDAFPLLTSVDQLREQLTALLREDHDYKTVIIDSVTMLERLFVKHVVESDPTNPKTIKQAVGGYGAGHQAVVALHEAIRASCESIRKRRGMAVIFLAHTDVKKVEEPDNEPYYRYCITGQGKSDNDTTTNCYINNVDLAGFLRLETFVTDKDGSKNKKGVCDGTRILMCRPTAVCVSKNRYGITKDLIVKAGENPLIPFIPFFNQPQSKPDAQPKKGLTITSFDDEPAGTQPTQPQTTTENTGA